MLLNAYSIMHEMREQALIGLEARTAFVAYYLYDVRNNMQNVHTQGVHTQRISQTLPKGIVCLLYTSPSPRDLSTSRMPSSA